MQSTPPAANASRTFVVKRALVRGVQSLKRKGALAAHLSGLCSLKQLQLGIGRPLRDLRTYPPPGRTGHTLTPSSVPLSLDCPLKHHPNTGAG